MTVRSRARPDVLIAGLGAMGAATALQAQRKGLSVAGFDRFRPPHAQGSSHGQTRITRQAIGEGEHLVPLVLNSHAIWRELEAISGESLFHACGALMIGAPDGGSLHHGQPGFLHATIAAARRHGIAHDLPTPDETMRRWPQFRLQGDEIVYFEPGGGMVFPERCIAVQLQEAARRGADLHFDEPILSYSATPDAVQVETAKGRYSAGQLVIAAGAWAPGLLADRLPQLTLTRQVLHWLSPMDPARFDASLCPVYIVAHGQASDAAFYGFPLVPGAEAEGVKVADEQYGRAIASPDDLDRHVRPAETAALFANHLDGRLHGLAPSALRTAACMYTSTPDGQFLVERLAETPRILLVSACSGHGFKHSAGLGAKVADMLAEGPIR